MAEQHGRPRTEDDAGRDDPRPRPSAHPVHPDHPARSQVSEPTVDAPWQPRPRPTRTAASPWQDRLRTQLRFSGSTQSMPVVQIPEKTESGPSVPRVLDLALRTGELLLASGEGGEDVEAAMLGITDAYGLERCQPNVTFVAITLSYQPSLVEAPVTGERVVRRRAVDYTRLDEAHQLVEDITGADLTLEEAYHRLADIRRNRHPYPRWLLLLSAGLIAAFASVMVGGGPVVAVAACVAALIGERLAQMLSDRGVPEFYQFVLASMPAAAVTIGMIKSGVGINPYAVVTGGLFALLPGRALVAAVQDGLTGFYITAAARLLEVFYLIIGIIVGISIVIYAGDRLGVEFAIEGTFNNNANPRWVQFLAAGAVSLTFAVLVQVRRALLPMAVIGGAIGWSVFQVLREAGAAPVLATAVSTGLLGLLGQLLARVNGTSALPYVIPAIGPMLPGSAMYQGMLGLALGHTDTGWLSLVNAASLALALAAGVNVGSEAARFVLPTPPTRTGREMRPASKRTRGF